MEGVLMLGIVSFMVGMSCLGAAVGGLEMEIWCGFGNTIGCQESTHRLFFLP